MARGPSASQRSTHGEHAGTGPAAARYCAPVGEVIGLDINVTSGAADFACTGLITDILAPAPLDRIWLVNNLPDWQLDHEHERELQAVRTAIEELITRKSGHAVVAGDFDAAPAATSIRPQDAEPSSLSSV